MSNVNSTVVPSNDSAAPVNVPSTSNTNASRNSRRNNNRKKTTTFKGETDDMNGSVFMTPEETKDP